MYITKIALKNIRCFGDETTFDLSSANDARKWTVIVGDNGVGKTTLLRAIAMGLCDKDSASALLRDSGSDLIRKGADSATIRVDLWDEEVGPCSISTTFARSVAGPETVEHHETWTESKQAFPWQKMFVCGYGANRGVGGADEPSEEYSVADAVYTLINYDWDLLAPESSFWRLTEGDDSKIHQIREWLNHILTLPEGDTVNLTTKGIRIRTTADLDLPISACADGYEATVTWILDVLCRFLQANSWKMPKPWNTDFSGIVLIDELEQHLHPRLQKEIIGRLSRQFPKLQFIVTTHSPLCAVGAADLSDEECGLVLLSWEETHVSRHEGHPPRRQRADQVLTSYLFGLTSTRSEDVASDIARYSHLKAKKELTQQESNELGQLNARLTQELGSQETELQRKVEDAVSKALQEMSASWLASANIPSQAVDWEIKRQLGRLFNRDARNDQD